MKKLLLTLMLAVVSTSAMAEWIRIGEVASHDDHKKVLYEIYYDSDTSRQKEDKVKVWLLYDYSEMQHRKNFKPFISTKQHNEYDCKNDLRRINFQVHFTKKMGRGKRTEDEGVPVWEPIEPDTIVQDMWEFFCNK